MAPVETPKASIDKELDSSNYSVQELVDSSINQLTSIPSHYAYFKNPNDSAALPGDDIPVIDFSMLISDDLDQRSQVLDKLGKACRDWSFFLVKNHGIPDKVYEEVFEASEEFNMMPDSEKQEFKMKKDVMDRIRFGSSNNLSTGKAGFWRDYLKLFLHPDFNAPHKPVGFSEKLLECTTRQREVTEELLKGVSKTLGVEENYLHDIAERDKGMDFFAVNIYPPCPQPELAVGLAPHTDFGLLIIVTANGVGGLQIQHDGKWFNVNAPPNYLMVNFGDHMEILTNGKYKSLVHRAMVNSKCTRMSLATIYGPEVNKVVVPAPEFVDDGNPAAYRGMRYGDYFIADQTSTTKEVTSLDLVRI